VDTLDLLLLFELKIVIFFLFIAYLHYLRDWILWTYFRSSFWLWRTFFDDCLLLVRNLFQSGQM